MKQLLANDEDVLKTIMQAVVDATRNRRFMWESDFGDLPVDYEDGFE